MSSEIRILLEDLLTSLKAVAIYSVQPSIRQDAQVQVERIKSFLSAY